MAALDGRTLDLQWRKYVGFYRRLPDTIIHNGLQNTEYKTLSSDVICVKIYFYVDILRLDVKIIPCQGYTGISRDKNGL